MTCREVILTTLLEEEACLYSTLERVCSISGCPDYTWESFEVTMDRLQMQEAIHIPRYQLHYCLTERGIAEAMKISNSL